jgi:hypothetical protein
MARYTFHQRAERALRLILGMRSPSIAEQLAEFGFCQDVLEEGWDLMRCLTAPGELIESRGNARTQGETTIEEWVQLWIPIARGVIHASHPGLEAWLFQHLRSARGKRTVPLAGTFLDRLNQLEAGDDPHLQDGPAAVRLLEKHGLTPDKRREMAALVEQAWQPKTAQHLVRAPEQDRAAADALWVWYLKWSEIARAAIKNKAQLRALGFSPRRQGKGEDVVVDSQPHTIQLELVREKVNAPKVFLQRLPELAEPKS